MRDGPRAVGIALLAALAASQAALVVLNPLLPDVAHDLGVSVATAGQLRTVSGLAAGIAALTAGLWATRLGLRELLFLGVGTLAVGSLVSAIAPDFPVLIAAQVLAGFGIGISYSAAVAATAEWSTPADRSRVLAIALLGPPLAWIVGMPLVGAVGEVSWRLAWLVIPVCMALVATVLLLRRPATPPATGAAGLRTVFTYPGVVRWSTGELLAFSGWAGALVYVGALLVDTYDLSIAATGLALGFGALVYVPGNLLFRRWVDAYSRRLAGRPRDLCRRDGGGPLRVAAGGVVHDRGVRGALVHRRRSNARRERAWARARARGEAGSHGRKDRRSPVRVLRRRRARRHRARERRLLVGRARVRALFVGAAIPHLVPLR